MSPRVATWCRNVVCVGDDSVGARAVVTGACKPTCFYDLASKVVLVCRQGDGRVQNTGARLAGRFNVIGMRYGLERA